jgi:hypothetical protein
MSFPSLGWHDGAGSYLAAETLAREGGRGTEHESPRLARARGVGREGRAIVLAPVTFRLASTELETPRRAGPRQ